MVEAFEIFEWMVAGYGSYASVPATQETYVILLTGCHEVGALEKALEVLSWMHSTNMKPTAPIFAHLTDTINIATLWDAKVLTANSTGAQEQSRGGAPRTLEQQTSAGKLHNAIMPCDLRPAPYNGLRSLYLKDPSERIQVRSARFTVPPFCRGSCVKRARVWVFVCALERARAVVWDGQPSCVHQQRKVQDRLLALTCLPKDTTWVPSMLQAPATDLVRTTSGAVMPQDPVAEVAYTLEESVKKLRGRCGRRLLDMRSQDIPQHLRQRFANLSPYMAEPRVELQTTVGYSMHVRSRRCDLCVQDLLADPDPLPCSRQVFMRLLTQSCQHAREPSSIVSKLQRECVHAEHATVG